MGKYEARRLSDALFRRLAGLNPEDPVHSYVRGTVIELNMPLVRFVASRFRHRPEELDDIVQVGTVGLIKAVDGFDPDRGVEFVTYAIPTISGEIKRFFRDTSWPLRVPRSVQERYLAAVRASDRLEQALGRLPDTAELAAELHVTEDEAAEGLEAGRLCRCDSLDSLRDDGSDDAGSALINRLGGCDPELEVAELRVMATPFLSRLPERERTVLLLRFWGGLTQSEIAARIGVSQMHVSRILAATLAGLRERIEHGGDDGGESAGGDGGEGCGDGAGESAG
ncbi:MULTISPECIES: SigB/SigF/SigG family RNA polymerase sigma factor [Kitasatospora]|uniref:Putative RNA polymerase sigma factor n=1 Tax=Kitasatospora setae (strain ATCC 33774 / DSM 43861 / JCM 3304 / KCC A-0304 / NBRC 14216 / KM-6054) TaxID=452652 RepID=E4N5R6_KITSK|nr:MULTISPECIES: SigB/SigF/SigG family RNA polymerase sigma factor [Kitasatospora]BAJ26547.1 putative RNA polymerase sigma factor [Kitasatospora setae KM-6054]